MKHSDNVANYKHQETEWEELPVVGVKVKTHCWFLRITQEGLEAYPGMQQLLVKEMIFHK